MSRTISSFTPPEQDAIRAGAGARRAAWVVELNGGEIQDAITILTVLVVVIGMVVFAHVGNSSHRR